MKDDFNLMLFSEWKAFTDSNYNTLLLGETLCYKIWILEIFLKLRKTREIFSVSWPGRGPSTFYNDNVTRSSRVGVKMCTLFLWARGLRARVARPPATSTKKSVHSLTPTLQLKSWNVATNVILFVFIRTYRAKKKKEEKKQKRIDDSRKFFWGKNA